MDASEFITAREVDGTRKSVRIADLSFRVSVYGVVLNGPNVLLVPQWDGYDIPGGGVKLGEPIRDAIAREVFEETGLTVTPLTDTPLLVQDDLFIHPTTQHPYHTILLYYLCDNPTGTITDKFFEHDERSYSKTAEWVNTDLVRNLKFYNPIDNALLIERAKSKYQSS